MTLLNPKWITIENVQLGKQKQWQNGAPIPSGWKYVSGDDVGYHPLKRYCLNCDTIHAPVFPYTNCEEYQNFYYPSNPQETC